MYEYNKGAILFNLGRHQEAIECFDKALELDPKCTVAWWNKGAILGKLGKKDEAEECFKRARELGLGPARGE